MRVPVIAGVGSAYLEYCGKAETIFRHGRPAEFEQLLVQPSGRVPVALATATSLGCEGRLASVIPDDFAGRFVREKLRLGGLDTRHVIRSHGQLCPLQFVVRQSGICQSFHSEGDLGIERPPSWDAETVLHGAQVLLLTDEASTPDIALAKAAARDNVLVICDIAQPTPRFRDLAELASILIVSERLASEMTSESRVGDVLRRLAKKGPRAVITTLGDAGCAGICGEEIVVQPAFSVDAIDAHGAGDVFAGALAAATVSGLPFASCLRFASAAAASACTRLGSWAAIPTRMDVMDLLATELDQNATAVDA